MKEYLKSIEFLDENAAFLERENGKYHTSYETEILFYSTIMHGDTQAIGKRLEQLLSDGIVAGHLSVNNLRQMKYWAVSCITLAARYAIQGGLPEMDAYNLSDAYIRDIDMLNDENDIMKYLLKKCFEITEKVNSVKNQHSYPAPIRKCVTYIDNNLHTKISMQDLSQECGLSNDYLSQLFKKTTGITVTEYIKKRRLSSACQLLNRGVSLSDTAYALGFCSESYFISCFKQEYGITPKEYVKSKGEFKTLKK